MCNIIENSYCQGYVTEKLVHPYVAGAIALYKGGADYRIYNERSIISRDLYNNDKEYVDYVYEVCKSKELYNKYMSEPLFINNHIPDRFKPEGWINWLKLKLPGIL